jgi:hypothetical protein
MLVPALYALFKFTDLLLSTLLISDCDDCGFEHLGYYLFGGLAVAIGLAVALVFIKMRVQDKKSSSSAFLSISASEPRRRKED